MSDFIRLVSTTCLLDDADINDTLRSTLENSWYQLPNSPDIFAPSTGTRPGDPLADVLFGFAMSDVLWEVYYILSEHPEILQIPKDTPAGTTWADDTCVFLSGDAATLEQRAGMVYSTVHEALTKRGLVLSHGPHKTALIMAFRGPDSKPLHRRMFTRSQPEITSCLEYGGAARIGVQFLYKHLGSLADVSGSLLPEIRVRGGRAFHAVRPLMKSCLANSDIDLKRRRQILQSLGMSVATHNIGTWRRLTKGEFEAWSAQVWKLYGCLIPRDFVEKHPHIGLEYAAANADNYLPDALLHVERLRLLCQILRYPDEGLACSLQDNYLSCGKASWWACILDAFAWLHEVAGSAEAIAELRHLEEPMQLASTSPTLATLLHKALKLAKKNNRHFLQQWLDLQWADDTMKQVLTSDGWQVPQQSGAQEESLPQTVGCPECNRLFKDAASLATHRFKAHNVKVAARRFAPTTTCIACGKGFSTRPRLIVHLQYSAKRCLPWLLMNSSPIDEAEATRLDVEAAEEAQRERRTGIRSSSSRMPVNYEGANSVPQVQIDEIVVTDRPVMEGIDPIGPDQHDFLHQWKAKEGVWPMCDTTWMLFTDALIVALDQCPYECHQSFAGRLTEMVDEVCWRQDDFEIVLAAQERLAAVLHAYAPSRKLQRQPLKSKTERLREWEEAYGSLPVWMGLRSTSSRPRFSATDASAFPSRLASAEHGWQEEIFLWQPGGKVPRQQFPSEVFYLVLFSGHRRADDIASQVWRLEGTRKIWPICLDMCLDQEEGNLLETRVQLFWKARIMDGVVIGMHASPPCETYTEARHLPPPPGQIKPRPLRSWTFPWCLPGMDSKELRQITVGNALYFVALIFACWLLVGGGCASIEHPKGCSPAEGRFTIWASSFMRRICQHAECFPYTFCQGPLGQISLKPTTFMLLRLPGFPRLQRKLSTYSGPYQRLGGQNEDGSWKTSRAKEFPPNLCRAIAEAVQCFSLSKSVASTVALSWPRLPDCVWQPFDPYALDAAGTRMGPDFWGWPPKFGGSLAWPSGSAHASTEWNKIYMIQSVHLFGFMANHDFFLKRSLNQKRAAKVLGRGLPSHFEGTKTLTQTGPNGFIVVHGRQAGWATRGSWSRSKKGFSFCWWSITSCSMMWCLKGWFYVVQVLSNPFHFKA